MEAHLAWAAVPWGCWAASPTLHERPLAPCCSVPNPRSHQDRFPPAPARPLAVWVCPGQLCGTYPRHCLQIQPGLSLPCRARALSSGFSTPAPLRSAAPFRPISLIPGRGARAARLPPTGSRWEPPERGLQGYGGVTLAPLVPCRGHRRLPCPSSEASCWEQTGSPGGTGWVQARPHAAERGLCYPPTAPEGQGALGSHLGDGNQPPAVPSPSHRLPVPPGVPRRVPTAGGAIWGPTSVPSVPLTPAGALP